MKERLLARDERQPRDVAVGTGAAEMGGDGRDGDIGEIGLARELGEEILSMDVDDELEQKRKRGMRLSEEGELEEADTKATIGPYTFVIERGQYLEWMEQIRQRVGFDKEAIVEELKRRLGL